MKRFLQVTCLGVAALTFTILAPDQAHAQRRFWRNYGGPYSGYYGNGGHDFVPHWHDTYTPFGAYRWYGNGPHDFQPHAHSRTPFSYRSYSLSPWGYTRSYHSPYPYYYSPW